MKLTYKTLKARCNAAKVPTTAGTKAVLVARLRRAALMKLTAKQLVARCKAAGLAPHGRERRKVPLVDLLLDDEGEGESESESESESDANPGKVSAADQALLDEEARIEDSEDDCLAPAKERLEVEAAEAAAEAAQAQYVAASTPQAKYAARRAAVRTLLKLHRHLSNALAAMPCSGNDKNTVRALYKHMLCLFSVFVFCF